MGDKRDRPEGDVAGPDQPSQRPAGGIGLGEAERPQGRGGREQRSDPDPDPAGGNRQRRVARQRIDSPSPVHETDLAISGIIWGMAEGDTILRLARRVESALAGDTVSAFAPNPRGRVAGVEQLDGRQLDGAEARGKHLLLHFGDLVLHSHLGISGDWDLYPPGGAWRRPRAAAWVVLEGRDQEAVQFGGPTLRVVANRRLRRDPQLVRLGPDVLATEFDADAVLVALRTDPRRALGSALLDQSVVAGIGNVFKSEACFAAGVDPWRQVGEATDAELLAVLESARERMLHAVASGRGRPAVYGRRGPCPACGTAILHRGQGDGNRVTYWCPACQG